MTQNPAELIEEIDTTRIIGHIRGDQKGPTLVFFGGIHGNEPSGVKALERVFARLELKKEKVKGNIFGIRGNIPALAKECRFLENDLNRIWTHRGIQAINSKGLSERTSEEEELVEIHRIISEIVKNDSPPFYFIDFHTTSSPTLPFITINDALINRKFASLFPLPVILGLEEYLEGPLLSYINEKGYVAIGFESGQHYTREAMENSIAFTWLTLLFTGVLPDSFQPKRKKYLEELKKAAGGNSTFYEVTHRHRITNKDQFNMLPGFRSFDTIKEGTKLASHNGEQLSTEKKSIVFMPLYQEQGEEGFFLIRKIPKWVLKLSAGMRKLRMDALLTLLPGISWASPEKDRLMINLKVARFLSKPLFHLLGYRSRTVDKTHILMSNRERAAKNEMYRNTSWYD
ncbi:MAG: succinylglutamate desuccinylase/aspartoacylase family protein [Flavobacteriaceae bacterium]